MKLAIETYALRAKFGDEQALRLIGAAGFDGVDYSFYYTSEDHTGVNVPVFTYGWNAEVFDGRVMENTQIPKTIAHMMGVTNFGDNDGFTSLIK